MKEVQSLIEAGELEKALKLTNRLRGKEKVKAESFIACFFNEN